MLEVLVNPSQFCVQPMLRCTGAVASSRLNGPTSPAGGILGSPGCTTSACRLAQLLSGRHAGGHTDAPGPGPGPWPPTTVCEPQQREWFCPRELTSGAVDSPRVERRLHEFRFVEGSQQSYLPLPLPATDGWVTLNMTLTAPYELTVDLAPLGGAPVHAVRYAWGVRKALKGDGTQRDGLYEEPLCCAAGDDMGVSLLHPCEPASCPIMASGGLPANPFMARIVHGRCRCMPPQVCDA